MGWGVDDGPPASVSRSSMGASTRPEGCPGIGGSLRHKPASARSGTGSPPARRPQRFASASGSVRRNPERARRSARWANGEKWPAPVQTPLEGWSLAFSRPRETRPVPRGRERRREVRQTWTRLSLRPKGCVDATVTPDRREHSSRAIGGVRLRSGSPVPRGETRASFCSGY